MHTSCIPYIKVPENALTRYNALQQNRVETLTIVVVYYMKLWCRIEMCEPSIASTMFGIPQSFLKHKAISLIVEKDGH